MILEDLHSDLSEPDEDISTPRKIIPNFKSSDSDLGSYDGSSGHGKEPASRRPCKKEGISYKMTPSLSQQHKGIV